MVSSVIGAVVGGIANKALGGNKRQSGGSQSQHTTTEVTIPEFLESDVTNLLNRSNEFYNRPYEAFTGDRFAPFNQDQLAAFSGIRDLVGQYQPLLDNASGLSTQLADRVSQGFVTPERIESFINPYQQNVTDIAKRETLRDYEKELNRIGDYAGQMGAFGGSRHAILEAEAGRNVGQRLSDIQATGLNNAYDRATQLALQSGVSETQGLSQAANQMANLAGLSQSYGLQGLGALQAIGGQQQALSQSGLDFDYQQFLEEREYPGRQIQSQLGTILPFLGGTSVGNIQNYNPGLSNSNAALGGAFLGNSILGNIGNPFSGGGGSPWSMSSGGVPIPGTKPSQGGGSFLGGLASGIGNFFGGLFSEGGPVKGYREGGCVKNHPKLSDYACGGHVKKYQSGGLVDRLLEDLMSVQMGMTEGIGSYLDPDRPRTAFEEDVSGFGGTLKENIADPLTRAGLHTTKDIVDIMDYFTQPSGVPSEGAEMLKKAVDRADLKPRALELFRQIEKSYDNRPTKPLMNTLDKIREKEGLPTIIPKEKPIREEPVEIVEDMSQPDVEESSKGLFDNVDMPMLAAGARILQTPGMNPMSALGAGIDRYMEVKGAEGKAAFDSKQQEFENLLAQMKATQYMRQNDLQEERLALEKEFQPFKKATAMAEIQKMQSEAGAIGDPIMTKAVENAEKIALQSPNYYNTREMIQQLVREQYEVVKNLQKAQGMTPDTQVQGDPFGWLQE